MASPLNWQEKQCTLPVLRFTVADGVLSSCSPVGQEILMKPSLSGTGEPV